MLAEGPRRFRAIDLGRCSRLYDVYTVYRLVSGRSCCGLFTCVAARRGGRERRPEYVRRPTVYGRRGMAILWWLNPYNPAVLPFREHLRLRLKRWVERYRETLS